MPAHGVTQPWVATTLGLRGSGSHFLGKSALKDPFHVPIVPVVDLESEKLIEALRAAGVGRPDPLTVALAALEAERTAAEAGLVPQGPLDEERPSEEHGEAIPTDPAALLSKDQAAQLLGCSVRQVDRLFATGDLAFVRPTAGGRRFVERAEVERFIRRREQAR